MRPTPPLLLVAVSAVCGVGGGFGLDAAYGSAPPLPVVWTITVGVIAVLVAFLAWTTRNRLRGARDARPVEPLTVARFAALARACSPVGVAVAGGWLGALVWLLVAGPSGPTASHDRGVAIAGLVTGLLLTAAALWLERICRVRVDGRPGR